MAAKKTNAEENLDDSSSFISPFYACLGFHSGKPKIFLLFFFFDNTGV
jgi:hypothetical protein